MANTTVANLIQKYAESKGTGKDRPGKRDKIIEMNTVVLSLLDTASTRV